ncbi:hypothetical protein IE81DRAFT_319821 [Ceraceosorus guamensis]|uniref:Uncharacterized protein n=1 Tax=Ceraceosorus guamensis TaxID=1522189 RepID=A0A316W7U6_9BASI|nr:hypothetical protein IE81DRAFT_319821 [Ceraceosorus guamensis]PWN45967.1 hypothetical protein IE81DRAFT_319821 [Ceraceosorus guamensis]
MARLPVWIFAAFPKDCTAVRRCSANNCRNGTDQQYRRSNLRCAARMALLLVKAKGQNQGRIPLITIRFCPDIHQPLTFSSEKHLLGLIAISLKRRFYEPSDLRVTHA